LSSRPHPFRPLSGAAILVGCLLAGPVTVPAQQSASYVMDRVTATASAHRLSSASFDLSVTVAQEGPVGSVSFCNGGFLQSTGFWSVLGEHPAPVKLRVAWSTSYGAEIELTWSGSAPSFDVYRSDAPESIVNGANLTATTTGCETTDTPPAEPSILYYLVVPGGG
jgi:hypothetical protein